MTFTLVSSTMPDLLPMRGRSSGRHVSHVIHDLCIRLGYFEDGKELQTAWAQLGCALEWAVIERYQEHYPDRYVQIGELERDGVYGTPDLFDTEEGAVVEIKLSWMSAKHDADSVKYWRYWMQVRAYCYMMGVNVGYLHVCHVNGNYKWSEGGGPIYKVWRGEWSDAELEETWETIRRHEI